MAILRNLSFLLIIGLYFTGCSEKFRVSGMLKIVDGPNNDTPPANATPGGESETVSDDPVITVPQILALTLAPLALNSTDFAQSVSIAIPFSGDDNSNADLTFYYCSAKANPGCDPLSGPSLSLERGVTEFAGEIIIANSVVTPGDFLKYRLVSSDAEGITGGEESGALLIPLSSTSENQYQYNDFHIDGVGSGGRQVVAKALGDGSGSHYIAGHTYGHFGGPSGGKGDVFLAKIKSDGALDETWSGDGLLSLGLLLQNHSYGDEVVVNMIAGPDGRLYILGYTDGPFGGPNAGMTDVFVLKMNPSTAALDTSFGNGDGSDGDGILQINSVNTANASNAEISSALAIDHLGNLYIVGNTLSSLGGANAGGEDGFIIKVSSVTGLLDTDFGDGDGSDNDGVLQLNAAVTGTSNGHDYFYGVVVDGANQHLYAVGKTFSNLSGTTAGGSDAFVAKFDFTHGTLDPAFGDGDGADNDGILQVTNTYTTGTNYNDSFKYVLLDGAGNLFVAGNTEGAMGGVAVSGYADLTICKMNATSGQLDGSFGDGDSTINDGITSISEGYNKNLFSFEFAADGHLLLGGSVRSSFGGTNAGDYSGYVAKITNDSGELDNSFGSGDGGNSDGKLILNNTNTLNASKLDAVKSIVLLGSSKILVIGETRSDMDGAKKGTSEIFLFQAMADSGMVDTTFGGGNGIVQIGIANGSSASEDDHLLGMKSDGLGNIYLYGYTTGALGGPNRGGSDGFIMKVNIETGRRDPNFGDGDGTDGDGILQIGGNPSYYLGNDEKINDIELDGAGNIYFCGDTVGIVSGASNAGGNDIIVGKISALTGSFDSDFGDGDGTDDDGIVQINNTNAGNTGSSDHAQDLVLDGGGNLYIVGDTWGIIGGSTGGGGGGTDMIVLKMDTTHGLLDSSFGDGDGVDNDGIIHFNGIKISNASTYQYGDSIVLDGIGNLFVAGITWVGSGGPSAGSGDIFVVKMEGINGNLDAQFGDGDGTDDDGVLQVNNNNATSASGRDRVRQVLLSGTDLYLIGNTASSMGVGNSGSDDGLVIKLSAISGIFDSSFGDGDGVDDDGILLFNNTTVIAGTASGEDLLNRGFLDSGGKLFVVGSTKSSLGGPLGGGTDGFVAKIDAISGALETNFGSGDGGDNDGVIQLNNATTLAATGNSEVLFGITDDGLGNIVVGGSSNSPLSGGFNNGQDLFYIIMNSSSGSF